MDQDKMIKIYARSDSRIQLKMIPGHFVTSQSHITHYLDLTTMKSRCAEAQRIAATLAANYEASIPVDTIVCMDGLEVIGAYLAEELTKAGVLSMNAHQTIYVITPEFNSTGQMIFRDNYEPMINNKNILILNGSITTGSTLNRAIESVLYADKKSVKLLFPDTFSKLYLLLSCNHQILPISTTIPAMTSAMRRYSTVAAPRFISTVFHCFTKGIPSIPLIFQILLWPTQSLSITIPSNQFITTRKRYA